MASKDKARHTPKKAAKKSLKEKRQEKKVKAAKTKHPGLLEGRG